MARISDPPNFSSLENPCGLFVSSWGISRKKMGFKIAIAYTSLSQLLPGILKRPEPKRSKCSTPGFKFRSSNITLNTFRVSQTHPNWGCLSHTLNMTPIAQRLALVSIMLLGQIYLWYFQTVDGVPFIQCNSRYPLEEGEISPYENLNRCQACTIHQDRTKHSIETIFVQL